MLGLGRDPGDGLYVYDHFFFFFFLEKMIFGVVNKVKEKELVEKN